MDTLILHLSLIKGIGPVAVAQIVDALERNKATENAYCLSVSDWHRFGISMKMAQAVYDGLSDKLLLEKELECYHKNALSWVTYKDAKYPELLRHIYAPPSVITWRGDLNFDKSMAVVGSRDATAYGLAATRFFVEQLVSQGYTIVSGGAYGIDAQAHSVALEAGGKTIVILGSGILRPYPHEHKKLFEAVVETGGAVVSIFPATASAMPGNFPARNRVIAGLSQGCIIVQAARKSGAKITAEFALQQGRSVFAVPGPFDHSLSEGCHDLIKQGARLLTSMEDIADEFGITLNRKPIMDASISQLSPIASGTEAHVQKQRSVTLQKVAKEDPVHPIVHLCATPTTFDELLKKVSYTASELQEILFDLNLEGVVEQDYTGMWRRVSLK